MQLKITYGLPCPSEDFSERDIAQFTQTATTSDCSVVPFGILKAFTKAAAQGLFSVYTSH